MPTIGNLNYQITADMTGFQRGMIATKKELSDAKTLFRESRTDAENFGLQMDYLQNLLAKGVIDDDLFQRAVQMATGQDKAAEAARQLQAEFDSLNASLNQQIATFGMTSDELVRYKLEQQGIPALAIAHVEALQQQLAALRQQQAETQAAAAQQQAFAASIDTLTARLREQADTAGMTADEIELYRLAQRGATIETLAEVKALQTDAREKQQAAAASKSLEADVERLTQSLREEIATVNMDQDAVQRWRLEQRGASKDVLELVESLQRQRNALRAVDAEVVSTKTSYSNLANDAAQVIPQLSGIQNVMSLSSPVMMGLAVAIGEVVIAYKALSAVAEFAVRNLVEANEQILEIGKAANNFGIAIGSYQSLMNAASAAGVETNNVRDAIRAMSSSLAEASKGGNDKAAVFDRLGLSVHELKNMEPDKAFLKLADAIASVENPTDRVYVAMKLFEEETGRIAGFFGEVNDAVKEQKELLDSMGLTLTELDYAAVKEMNSEFSKLGIVLDGVWQKLLVELAPALTAIIRDVTEWLASAEGKDTLSTTLENVKALSIVLLQLWNDISGAVGRVSNNMDTFAAGAKGTVDFLSRVTGFNVSSMLDAATAAGKAYGDRIANVPEPQSAVAQVDSINQENMAQAERIKKNREFTAAVEDQTQTLSDLGITASAAGSAVSDAFKPEPISNVEKELKRLQDQLLEITAGTKGAAINRMLFEDGATDEQIAQYERLHDAIEKAKAAKKSQEQRDEALERTTKALREQLDTWGMTADEIERYKLAQAGVSTADIADVKQMQDQRKALQDQQKLAEEAKRARESLKTPEEKYTQEALKLRQMLDAGELSLKQYTELRDKAQKDLIKPIKVGPVTTEGLAAGSAEAFDLIQQHYEQAQAKINQPIEPPLAFSQDDAKTMAQDWWDQFQQTIANDGASTVQDFRDQMAQQLDQPPVQTEADKLREQLNRQLDQPATTEPVDDKAQQQIDLLNRIAEALEKVMGRPIPLEEV